LLQILLALKEETHKNLFCATAFTKFRGEKGCSSWV